MRELSEEDERDLKRLARRLRIARANTGMTQAEAGAKASVNPSLISLYENKKREPMTFAVVRLAKAYGVSMDWLVGLEDTETP